MADDTRRRQERGKRRMAAILDAASQVFVEVGYDAATTNRIAAEANISPGSLYQYFPNKRAIAEALVARDLADMQAMYDEALDPNLASLPLPALIDRVIDPMVEFHLTHPAAKALMAGADLSAELAAATEELHAYMQESAGDLIAVADPKRSRRERSLRAQMCVQIVKAALPMITSSRGAQRKAVVTELKRALVAYLSH